MVLIREPEAAEVVFRHEGRYPTRIQMLDDNLQWLFKKLNLPVPFPFLYANQYSCQCVHASLVKLFFTAGATRSGKSIGQLITSRSGLPMFTATFQE